jgi:hypothetical protein
VDAVNGYLCACPAGYTGDQCQTDIDDCRFGPCQNGGVCIDAVNAYVCDCPADTAGDNCEMQSSDGTLVIPRLPPSLLSAVVDDTWLLIVLRFDVAVRVGEEADEEVRFQAQ